MPHLTPVRVFLRQGLEGGPTQSLGDSLSGGGNTDRAGRPRWPGAQGRGRGGDSSREDLGTCRSFPSVLSRELTSMCVPKQGQGKSRPEGLEVTLPVVARGREGMQQPRWKPPGPWTSGKTVQGGLASRVSYSSPHTDPCSTPPNVSQDDLKGSGSFLATVSQSKVQEY